jgi:hypothetical protein
LLLQQCPLRRLGVDEEYPYDEARYRDDGRGWTYREAV